MAPPQKLTAGQIYQLALKVGFPAEDARIMTAIALAESGGRIGAVGDMHLRTSKWGPSVGLWQIRSLNSQRGTGGQRDAAANVNPENNARAAFALYQARKKRGQKGFEDWSVWKKGTYRKHLSAVGAQRAAPGSTAPSTSPRRGFDPALLQYGITPGALAASGESLSLEDLLGLPDVGPDYFGDLQSLFGDGGLGGPERQPFTPPPFKPLPEQEVDLGIKEMTRRGLGRKATPQDLAGIKAGYRALEQRAYDQWSGAARAEYEGSTAAATIEEAPRPDVFAAEEIERRAPSETLATRVARNVEVLLDVIGA